MEIGIFDTIIIISIISLIINAVFQRIHMSVIVGYILVGILVGPNAFKLINNSENIRGLAEFGIVFLMFYIGLEFSLTKIISIRRAVFTFGGSQVFLTMLITMVIGANIGLTVIEAMIVGCITAMSSTAIVLKQLNEQLEISLPHGQNSVGILLFQDLAVIPILMMIPALNVSSFSNVSYELLLALAKGIGVIFFIILVGRKVLRPIYYNISATHSLELFTLTTLIIALGAAWLTNYLGLSLTLGAFIAGMMLGETEFRHQIKTDTRALKDVLLGLFFITIGMQLDLTIILNSWHWVALLLLALIGLKVLLIFLLGLRFSITKASALRTGLILAQGGEFGVAILHLAFMHELIPGDYAQVILGAILLSMCIAPVLIKSNEFLAKVLFRNTTIKTPYLTKEKFDVDNHVLLCGYGRVGQNIGRFLAKANLPYAALDVDPERVKSAQLAGEPVSYANISDTENLQHAGLDRAKMVVISIDSTQLALKVLTQIRKLNKRIPVIIRCKDERDTNTFYSSGATEVIPDILEASLTISAHVLLMMNIAPKTVDLWMDESRLNRYDLLRMVYPGQDPFKSVQSEQKQGLHVVTLTNAAFSVGKPIVALQLPSLNVHVAAIRRGNDRIVDPNQNFILKDGDIVVLYGDLRECEHAEKAFFEDPSIYN
jgi:CPA2 family monovalent cation:H+ antiporter-2